jgi:hypothetical protein
MTTKHPEATAPPSPVPGGAKGSLDRRRRHRFALALAVFGLWVAFLALLAFRADPPDAGPGANPGAELPALAPATEAP